MKVTISIERIVALLFVAVAAAAYYHSYFERFHRLGRDGYLAYQANHFDLYMANPTWGFPLYAGFFAAVIAVLVYEVAAFILGLFTNKLHSRNG